MKLRCPRLFCHFKASLEALSVFQSCSLISDGSLGRDIEVTGWALSKRSVSWSQTENSEFFPNVDDLPIEFPPLWLIILISNLFLIILIYKLFSQVISNLGAPAFKCWTSIDAVRCYFHLFQILPKKSRKVLCNFEHLSFILQTTKKKTRKKSFWGKKSDVILVLFWFLFGLLFSLNKNFTFHEGELYRKMNYAARRSVINFITLSVSDLAGLQEETLFNLHSYYLFLPLKKTRKKRPIFSVFRNVRTVLLCCSVLPCLFQFLFNKTQDISHKFWTISVMLLWWYIAC